MNKTPATSRPVVRYFQKSKAPLAGNRYVLYQYFVKMSSALQLLCANPAAIHYVITDNWSVGGCVKKVLGL
jgi:hypothetical protein